MTFSPKFLVGVLAVLAWQTGLHADTATFHLNGDPGQVYAGVNVGPYSGTLSGTNLTLFMCMDMHYDATFGGTYTGTTAHPATEPEDEAAFLASYLLSKGAPSSDPNFVAQYEGPISFAIWELMGTLGATPPDPAAAPFVQMAKDAYQAGLITSAYLQNILIFTPDAAHVQRFFTAFRDDTLTSVPEPGTMLLLGGGLLALVIRRRKRG